METPMSQKSITPIEQQWVPLSVDGSLMEMYIAKPSGTGPWPAIIVLMEIFGVNAYIRDVTERLAREGYFVVAPNYYHRTTANLELGYTEDDIRIGRQHKDKTTREGLLKDIRVVLDWLKETPDVESSSKVGCIGFCFGGHVAYIAASQPEIMATAAFYPGGVAVMSPGGGKPTIDYTALIHGEILGLFGEKDAGIPHEQVQMIEDALQRAGVRHEIVRYSQVGHGFFCDFRDDYDAAASEDAWHRVLALFKRILK